MAALNEAKEILPRKRNGESVCWRATSYGTKFFTGNILVGFSGSDDGESESVRLSSSRHSTIDIDQARLLYSRADQLWRAYMNREVARERHP